MPQKALLMLGRLRLWIKNNNHTKNATPNPAHTAKSGELARRFAKKKRRAQIKRKRQKQNKRNHSQKHASPNPAHTAQSVELARPFAKHASPNPANKAK